MQQTGPEQPQPEPRAAERPLILYVEDDVLIRMDTAERLRDAGYRVVEAASGAEALALLRAGARPDLLLSDLRMPGVVDGRALLDGLVAIAPAIPRLLTSSHLPQSGAPTASTAFLAKPYTGAGLLAAVERLVGR